MRRIALFLLLLPAACGGGNNSSAVVEANVAANAPANTPPGNTPEEVSITPEQREATRLYEEAGELSLKGDNTGALELLDRAKKILPDNALIHARMAFVYTELLRYDAAREAYLRASELELGTTRASLRARAAWCSHRLAIEAFNKQDYPAALKHLDESTGVDNSSADVHLLRGQVLYLQAEFAAAADAYGAAAAFLTGEKRNEARNKQGESQFHAGLYRPAIETFTALIDEGVEGYEVYGWRAYCYVQIGKKPEAESDFNQAARRTTDPVKRADYEEALRQLARVD